MLKTTSNYSFSQCKKKPLNYFTVMCLLGCRDYYECPLLRHLSIYSIYSIYSRLYNFSVIIELFFVRCVFPELAIAWITKLSNFNIVYQNRKRPSVFCYTDFLSVYPLIFKHKSS